MNFYCLSILIIFINFGAYNSAIAQKDSSFQNTSFNFIRESFQIEEGGSSHLYTGKEYYGYAKNIKGDQFFLTSAMESNTIFYDGSLYENIPLLFDIVSQEVIINRYHQDLRISLLSEKVKYFTLAGHRFENINTAQKDGKISDGIYDEVYKGTTNVLVKRSKRIVNAIRTDESAKFVEEDELFIQNGNAFYPVSGSSSLLQALSDKKDQVKIFIRKNKFKFKKNMEKEVILAAAYYTTLKT